MKKIFVLFVAVSFLAVAGFAFAMPKGPAETLILKAEKMKKPPVPFKHVTHAKIECSTCHHTWKGEGAPKKCESCHKLAGSEKPEGD